MAGKGDRNRTADHKAYQTSALWWRSLCCNAKVSKEAGVIVCVECGKACQLKK